MRKLPRTQEERVILAGSVWNRLCDEVERMDKIGVQSPLQLHEGPDGRLFSLVEPVREPHPGIVVCTGPSGESDFSDNRYWVARAYLANGESEDGGSSSAGESNGATDEQIYKKFPKDDPHYEIICVENDFEKNCRTHHVRPGTKIEFWMRYDLGSPPVARYFTLTMDEGTCGMAECGSSDSSSSSSSSTSDYCLYRWDCIYSCEDEDWGRVDGPNKQCIAPDDPKAPAVTEQWVKVPAPHGVCKYAFFRWGHSCPGDEQTDGCDDAGDNPDKPDFVPPSCCYYCLYRWEITYDCNTHAWTAVPNVPNKNCILKQDGPAITDEWYKDPDAPANVCRYIYYQWGPQCPGAEHTSKCPNPDKPDGKEEPPDDCCDSSSSALRCVYKWTCRYDCASQAWGEVREAGHSCVDPSSITHPMEAWSFGSTSTAADDEGSGTHGTCEYQFFSLGEACAGGEHGSCVKWPAEPAPPTDPPGDDRCPCASSGSSSDASGSSDDDCVEVIKANTLTFTFDADSCTVTPHYETVKVRKCDIK